MKHILFLSVLLFLSVKTIAYDFKHGDIYYNVINDSVAPYEVEVTYPDSDYFSACYTQEHIIIPSNVSYDGIKYNVTSIGNNAFYSDDQIKRIDIPNSVRTISHSVFASCASLESLHIGDGVESIDWNFFGCPNLQITIYAKNPPELTLYWKTNGCNTLYVPKESVYEYANAKGWGEFERIIPIGGNVSECIYNPNYDPKNKVTSVAGCKFDIDANEAVRYFNNKFKDYTERNKYEAIYVDVYFAGYVFDIMELQFANNDNTKRDEFRAIEFQKIYDLSDYRAAEECFKDIRNMYSRKYSNEQKHSESTYFYGMMEEDYDDLLPPIILDFKKGFSRSGKEHYYIIINYYGFNTSDRYSDDI